MSASLVGSEMCIRDRVRDAQIGPWWRDWMADQWAERLGFSELTETNDKDGLQVLFDLRKPGAEDL
eukprot:14786485-Alexandrium_andersonii.AAC.1